MHDELNHTLIYMTALICAALIVISDTLIIVFRPDASNSIITGTGILVALGVSSVLQLRAATKVQGQAIENQKAIGEVKTAVEAVTGQIQTIKGGQ